MRNETSISIDAPPERVWAVMTDVERWPEWTATVARAKRVDKGTFGVGSKARLKQPRVPTMTWTVSALEDGRSFEWTARAPGVRSVAGHRVLPEGTGSLVTLWVQQDGLVVRLMGGRFTKMAEEYLGIEAEGLKRRCEGDAS
ncbi:MAG TPA: SRPBCC family protein [Dehalococcoidia bacterium]|nr:SRPBCC family protein [Dehalococcoidia bacterium]